MNAIHTMTTPPSSSADSEDVTDFVLAPGETSVYGQKFYVSILAPYLKGRMMCSSSRFVYKVPNVFLGIIPVGSDENIVPINSISAVSTSTRFKVVRALLALILVILGVTSIAKNPLGGVICILLAIVFGLTTFSMALVVTNHAGGAFGLEVSILDISKIKLFKTELQNRVFADQEAIRHSEAQNVRMQSLAMQQVQLAQMQQAQIQQMQQDQMQQGHIPPTAQQQAQIPPTQPIQNPSLPPAPGPESEPR